MADEAALTDTLDDDPEFLRGQIETLARKAAQRIICEAKLAKEQRKVEALWECINALTGDDLWDDLPEWAQNWYFKWSDRWQELVNE